MNKPKSVAEEHPILDLTKQHLDIEADETAHSEALEMAIYFKRLEMPDIANMYQLKANHLKEDLIFKRGVLAGAELIMDLNTMHRQEQNRRNPSGPRNPKTPKQEAVAFAREIYPTVFASLPEKRGRKILAIRRIMELEFAPEKKVGDLLDDENYLRNMIDKDPSKNPLT